MIPSIMEIEVKFAGTEIIVTSRGPNSYLPISRESTAQNLILTRSWVEPKVTSPAIAEFQAQRTFPIYALVSANDPMQDIERLSEPFRIKDHALGFVKAQSRANSRSWCLS